MRRNLLRFIVRGISSTKDIFRLPKSDHEQVPSTSFSLGFLFALLIAVDTFFFDRSFFRCIKCTVFNYLSIHLFSGFIRVVDN
jgi:hypothetical protein